MLDDVIFIPVTARNLYLPIITKFGERRKKSIDFCFFFNSLLSSPLITAGTFCLVRPSRPLLGKALGSSFLFRLYSWIIQKKKKKKKNCDSLIMRALHKKKSGKKKKKQSHKNCASYVPHLSGLWS